MDGGPIKKYAQAIPSEDGVSLFLLFCGIFLFYIREI
jgi:hypothetical protein